MTSAPPPRVIQLGNRAGGTGGIAAVIRRHLDRGTRADLDVESWPSYDQDAPGFLSKNWPALSSAWRLARSSRHRPIVHAHVSQGGSLLREGSLVLLSRLLGHFTIVTLHGSDILDYGAFGRLMVRLAAAPAHIVHCYASFYPSRLGISQDRVVVVPNDVDVPPPDAIARKEKFVVFAGDVGRRKGADVLLEAWSRARPPGWRLLLAGKVTDLPGGEARIKSSPSSVEWLGELEHRCILQLLATASVLALPSRAEAFPVAVCEALAHGCAVIGTQVGGMGELLSASGQIVVGVNDVAELANSINTLARDATLLENAARRGRRYCEARLSPISLDETWRRVYRRESVAPQRTGTHA